MEIINNWEYARIIAQFTRIENFENFTLESFCKQVNPFFFRIMESPSNIFSIKEYDIKDDDNCNMFLNYKQLLLCLHKLMIRYGVEGCLESMYQVYYICNSVNSFLITSDFDKYCFDYISCIINCFFKGMFENDCLQFMNYYSKSFIDIVNDLSLCSDGDLCAIIKSTLNEYSIVENFINNLMACYDTNEDMGSKSRAISLLIYYITTVSSIDDEGLARSIYEFLLKILKKDFENFYTFENSCAFDVYNLKSIVGAFLKVTEFFDVDCITETVRTFIGEGHWVVSMLMFGSCSNLFNGYGATEARDKDFSDIVSGLNNLFDSKLKEGRDLINNRFIFLNNLENDLENDYKSAIEKMDEITDETEEGKIDNSPESDVGVSTTQLANTFGSDVSPLLSLSEKLKGYSAEQVQENVEKLTLLYQEFETVGSSSQVQGNGDEGESSQVQGNGDEGESSQVQGNDGEGESSQYDANWLVYLNYYLVIVSDFVKSLGDSVRETEGIEVGKLVELIDFHVSFIFDLPIDIIMNDQNIFQIFVSLFEISIYNGYILMNEEDFGFLLTKLQEHDDSYLTKTLINAFTVISSNREFFENDIGKTFLSLLSHEEDGSLSSFLITEEMYEEYFNLCAAISQSLGIGYLPKSGFICELIQREFVEMKKHDDYTLETLSVFYKSLLRVDDNENDMKSTIGYAGQLFPCILQLYPGNQDNIYLNEAIMSYILTFQCAFDEYVFYIMGECIKNIIVNSDDDILKGCINSFIKFICGACAENT